MTKFFLPILVCLAFGAVGVCQEIEQTLSVESSLEPAFDQSSTLDDDSNSILVELDESVESTEPFQDEIEELETPAEPMPETAELQSVTEPILETANLDAQNLDAQNLDAQNLDTANLVTPGIAPLSNQPINLPYNSYAIPQQPTTLIPGELNRIEPALAPNTPTFLPYQAVSPAQRYFPAPINPFPVAAVPTTANRYANVQPFRPMPLQQLQPIQRQPQLQVTRYTLYSYNTVNGQPRQFSQQQVVQPQQFARQQIAQQFAQQQIAQPQICQPRPGPIERMFRRFR